MGTSDSALASLGVHSVKIFSVHLHTHRGMERLREMPHMRTQHIHTHTPFVINLHCIGSSERTVFCAFSQASYCTGRSLCLECSLSLKTQSHALSLISNDVFYETFPGTLRLNRSPLFWCSRAPSLHWCWVFTASGLHHGPSTQLGQGVGRGRYLWNT